MTDGRDTSRRAREAGAVLVEFSLVVVIFVALLYGLISYGMAFALKQSMTNAASEAARAAVGTPSGATPESVAYTTADDRLDWLGSRCCEHADGSGQPNKPMDITATTAQCANDPSQQCITVTATYDYESSPLIPVLRLPGFGALFPERITTEATVQLPPPPPSP